MKDSENDFNASHIYIFPGFLRRCQNSSVTLLVEIQDKGFISQVKFPLQFGTNIYMIGLSPTFKSIKQLRIRQLGTSFLWKVLYAFDEK